MKRRWWWAGVGVEEPRELARAAHDGEERRPEEREQRRPPRRRRRRRWRSPTTTRRRRAPRPTLRRAVGVPSWRRQSALIRRPPSRRCGRHASSCAFDLGLPRARRPGRPRTWPEIASSDAEEEAKRDHQQAEREDEVELADEEPARLSCPPGTLTAGHARRVRLVGACMSSASTASCSKCAAQSAPLSHAFHSAAAHPPVVLACRRGRAGSSGRRARAAGRGGRSRSPTSCATLGELLARAACRTSCVASSGARDSSAGRLEERDGDVVDEAPRRPRCT